MALVIGIEPLPERAIFPAIIPKKTHVNALL
jgi:hypothetical protein